MMAGFNKFGAIAQALRPALKPVVANTATFIAQTYSDTAPRKTGFMANSGYVVTADESTYGQNVGAPPKDAYLLPEVEKPGDDLTAKAAVAANYAAFPEFGTRYQPPQPAWTPAVQAAQNVLDAQLALVEDRIQGMI